MKNKKTPVERDQYYVSKYSHALHHIVNVCNGSVHYEQYSERFDFWQPSCEFVEYFNDMGLVDTLFVDHYLMSLEKFREEKKDIAAKALKDD